MPPAQQSPLPFTNTMKALLDCACTCFPRFGTNNSLAAAWRSLIEKGKDLEHKASTFTQQPVVMEYVTDRLVTDVSQEIITGEINLLNRYAIIKATSKDYIRDSQIRVILQPILNKLKINLKFESAIEQRFQEIISQLRDSFATKPGYGGGNIINLLRQLKVDFTGYDFSNLTIWQADLQGATLHQLNLSYANINKSNFSQSLANILTIAFSPDGKLLASGDANGDICLWNTEDFQMRNVASLKGHIGWVWEMKFSSDGKTLVSCSEDGTIRIWNISTDKCLQVIKAHTTGCGTISLSPNGQILASGGADATIKLWNISNGKCLKIFKGHTQLLRSVTFSPDGEILVSASGDRTIKFWDVASGKCLYTLQGHTSEVLALAFSPDGLTLASGSADKTVKFWDINTGHCWQTLQGKHLESVVTVAFSPDGKTVAAAGEASTIFGRERREDT